MRTILDKNNIIAIYVIAIIALEPLMFTLHIYNYHPQKSKVLKEKVV